MRVWGACLCAGVLLMSTVAQALDSCEFARVRTSHPCCSEQSAKSGLPVCLICVSTHTPWLAAPLTSDFSPCHISNVCGTVRQSFISAPKMFALQVRPPPSL
jgi:hypothetical protein